MAFAEGASHPSVFTGNAPTSRRPVFVYTGMGPQWWAMGRECLEMEPIFRESMERLDHLFRDTQEWSLIDELSKNESESRVGRTEIAQTTNFALQVSLSELLRSWGSSHRRSSAIAWVR